MLACRGALLMYMADQLHPLQPPKAGLRSRALILDCFQTHKRDHAEYAVIKEASGCCDFQHSGSLAR